MKLQVFSKGGSALLADNGEFIEQIDFSQGIEEGSRGGLQVYRTRADNKTLFPIQITKFIIDDLEVDAPTNHKAFGKALVENFFVKATEGGGGTGGTTNASGTMFEIVNGVFQLKDSYLIAFGQQQGWGGGTPTLPKSSISFGSSTNTSNIVNWTGVTGATTYTLRRATNSSMTGSVVIYTGSLLTFTDTGLSENTTYYYTLTASATGYTSSVSDTTSKTTSGGGEFVIDRTIRYNFTSEYGGSAPITPFRWNDLKFPESVLQTPNSLLSNNSLTDTGETTTLTLRNTGALSGATNQVYAEDSRTALYPWTVSGSAFKFGRDGGGQLLIGGLTQGKYYHIYLGSAETQEAHTFVATVGGQTKNKVTYDAFGVPEESEFESVYYTEFKNVQPSLISGTQGITVDLNAIGFYEGFIGTLIVRESTQPMP